MNVSRLVHNNNDTECQARLCIRTSESNTHHFLRQRFGDTLVKTFNALSGDCYFSVICCVYVQAVLTLCNTFVQCVCFSGNG